MFTGIIQDTGNIINRTPNGESIAFTVKPDSQNFIKGIKPGDSISINGACMTVESLTDGTFQFTTIKESLKKTNLGKLKEGSTINLEKAMTMNSKLDGHIVQGHIDTTGRVKKIKAEGTTREYFIEFPKKFRVGIIHTGSIAINGISLTIAGIKKSKDSVVVKVAIIPHTFNNTNIRTLKVNNFVNIEFDMIGKYVKSIMKK